MNISSVKLFNKYFCLLLLAWVSICGAHTVCLAEEPEIQTQATVPSTSGRVIVINPKTGEIDPSVKTVPAELHRKATQATTTQEKFTYHDDGSVIVDFNGKFMKPVYGHLEDNGKLHITHGSGGKEQ